LSIGYLNKGEKQMNAKEMNEIIILLKEGFGDKIWEATQTQIIYWAWANIILLVVFILLSVILFIDFRKVYLEAKQKHGSYFDMSSHVPFIFLRSMALLFAVVLLFVFFLNTVFYAIPIFHNPDYFVLKDLLFQIKSIE